MLMKCVKYSSIVSLLFPCRVLIVVQCQRKKVCMLGYSGFFRLQGMYQGIVKATVFGVFEDLKFKISECLVQN